MENASKALIIAGSILIAIVLIAFGIRVVTSTEGTGDEVETTMKATEVATFNSKFAPYVGTKSIDKVKGLVNAVRTNNKVNSSKKVEIYIDNNLKSSLSAAISELEALKTTGTTRVGVEIDDTLGFDANGFVCRIDIDTTP